MTLEPNAINASACGCNASPKPSPPDEPDHQDNEGTPLPDSLTPHAHRRALAISPNRAASGVRAMRPIHCLHLVCSRRVVRWKLRDTSFT